MAGSPGHRKAVGVQGMAVSAPQSGEEASGQGGEEARGLDVSLYTSGMMSCWSHSLYPTWGRDSKTQTHTPHRPHAGRDLRVVHFSPSPDSPQLPHLQPPPALASHQTMATAPFGPTSHLISPGPHVTQHSEDLPKPPSFCGLCMSSLPCHSRHWTLPMSPSHPFCPDSS